MSPIVILKRLALAAITGALILPAYAVDAAPALSELPSFSKIDISSSLTARISVGGKQELQVEGASDRELERLRLEVVDGTLRAWMDRDFLDYFAPVKPAFAIVITVPQLTALAVDAESEVIASAMSGDVVSLTVGSQSNLAVRGIKARTVQIDASSGASLTVDGACERNYVQISSAASISGQGLACVDVRVVASSGSHAILFASRAAAADASSGAHIELFGHPTSVDEQEQSDGDVDVQR